jgi:hypothetical protein
MSDSKDAMLSSQGTLTFCIMEGFCQQHLWPIVKYEVLRSLFQEPSDALGISIAGGKGSPLGDIPIFIAMIQASGVAARTQKLKVRKERWLKH